MDAIKCLVLKPAKKTLLEVLYFHFEEVRSDRSAIKIQTGEHSYSTYSGSQSQFSLVVCGLFLLAIRHFARPPSQREIEYPLFRLAEEAQNVGFSSDQISALLLNDPYQKMILDPLHSTLPTQKPADRHSQAQALARNLRDLMNGLISTTGEDSKPWITVAGAGALISQRCGPAAWVTLKSDDDRDSDDLRHIFFNKMHLRPADLRRGGEGLTLVSPNYAHSWAKVEPMKTSVWLEGIGRTWARAISTLSCAHSWAPPKLDEKCSTNLIIYSILIAKRRRFQRRATLIDATKIACEDRGVKVGSSFCWGPRPPRLHARGASAASAGRQRAIECYEGMMKQSDKQ